MKRNFLKISFALMMTLLVGFSFTACKDDDDDDEIVDTVSTIFEVDGTTVTITDRGQGVGTMTMSADTTYVLDGLVFVNSGQILTIEPGTTIKGQKGQEANASALIVARGGKIMAEGTAEKPIIFTSEDDNGSLANSQRGLWGGLIILGKASLNSSPGETAIEGIPTTEPRALYGGTDDADNSGIVKYISIRHGGTDIGEGNEINGLTLGGVGSGTTIDYVEVIANKDDGIEFFGGKPTVKHALVSYCGDDCYDYDEGFRGMGQFWVAIQDVDAGDRMGEHDGGTKPEDGTPYAIPTIYNVTYIGRGTEAGKKVITLRDNAGGHYANAIFANQAKGIDIEVLIDEQCTYKQFQDDNLTIKNSIFSDVADGDANFSASYVGDSVDTSGEPVYDPEDDEKQLATKALLAKTDAAKTAFRAKFTEWGNSASTGVVTAANPVPASGTATDGLTPPAGMDATATYQGAFQPGGTNWAEGWTLTFPGSK